MKRVAIITITNSGMNFGNRLQNYALQTVLEGYSLSVETIYSAKNIKNSIFLSSLRRLLKKMLKTSKRRRCFNSFDKKHITPAKKVRYALLNDDIFKEGYNAFIAGSDQVWNPAFEFNSAFEFMTFAEPAKRYSYAASFGVSEIPSQAKERFAQMLNQLREISVREEEGRDIVKSLTGRETTVHLDPTMLLSADSYIAIEEKPVNMIPEKYLLTYFLGEKPLDYIELIKELAKKQHLVVLELSELPNSNFYNIGPQHFLYLYHNAEYICTDSFHGAIFSIIFHKQFTVFNRHDGDLPMGSRVKTLLGKTMLESRVFGELTIEDSLKLINYHQVDQLVLDQQEQADKYLRYITAQF